MKAVKIALALFAPTMLAASYMPKNIIFNNQYVSELQYKSQSDDDQFFRLPKQSYYTELFSKKELKKLAKAEKYRAQATEGLVIAAAFQKQADDLKTSVSEKSVKELKTLEAKANAQELKALKAFEKASDIYREVYTNELNNKTFSNANENEVSAKKLAKKAQIYYSQADNIKDSLTSENMLASYRTMYAKFNSAIYDQEIAFAVYQNSSTIDLSKYISTSELDTTEDGNVAKQNIPPLVAYEHYDFDKDVNIYRFRIHEFEEKLKISDDDKAAIAKIEASEADAALKMQTAVELGCKADTFRVYSSESTTLTEREYYEQKAQEQELNECSNLVKAIKAEVSANNQIFQIYQKYVPNVRDLNNVAAKNFEEQAETLFALSKTYEAQAQKQFSMVEQYTQLSEGNEVKLQAIQNMENAVASYLGSKTAKEQQSLATGAADHGTYGPSAYEDESDGAVTKTNDKKTDNGQKVADNSKSETKTDSNTSQKSDSKENAKSETKSDSKTEVADNHKSDKNSKNSENKSKTDSGKTSTGGKSTGTSSTQKEKVPVANSNAATVSTWQYNKSDERLMPYKYPSGTIFSVQLGQYKEMPEPVEFPAIETFLAENLKDQTYMRYYLGTFKTYDAAYAAMAMAKAEGYKKAQVVAFVNGKKTDVNTAKAKAEKTSGYQTLVQNELKKLESSKKYTTPVSVTDNSKNTGAAIPLTELTSTVYAVQISSVPTLLNMSAFNVSELYYDQNDAGLYRYYTGVSNDINIAKTNLQTMKASGYDDAYLVKVVDGKNLGAASSAQTGNSGNGNAKGTVYRVQIGAYTENLNADTKAKINRLKSNGYTVHTSQSGKYTVYTVGDCTTREQADKLKVQLRGQGFAESYVVTFVNGVKQ